MRIEITLKPKADRERGLKRFGSVCAFIGAVWLGLMLIAAPTPAPAASPALNNIIRSGIQWWSLPGSSLDCNFQTAQCTINRHAVPITSVLSITRANGTNITGNELVLWADGHYTTAPPNTLAISDLGLQVYESRKNNGLWARDLTQAAWVAVNVTPALTATGIDGAANSATTLTAGAANATILQSITLASGPEIYSVFLKRVSGTGTVNITLNGGISWTAVTLTSAWQRFSVTATVLNPIIGIQIVTSGDVIADDYSDIQPGTFLTPPIYTTTAAVTRAADVVTFINAGQTAAIASKSVLILASGSALPTTYPRLGSFTGAGYLYLNNSSQIALVANGHFVAPTFGSGSAGGTTRASFDYDATSFGGKANGGMLATTPYAWGYGAGFALGSNGATAQYNGAIQRVTFSPVKFSLDQLATAP